MNRQRNVICLIRPRIGRPHDCIAISVLLCWVGLSVTASRPVRAQVPVSDSARLALRVDSVFRPFTRDRSPGCAVGVARGSRVLVSRGYGLADFATERAITAETKFYAGSIAKQFTAAAVLLLAQSGKLSLDDDVRRFIPELQDYGSVVTVRDLLHHTSGVRDYLSLLPLAGLALADVGSEHALLRLIARQRELNFLPGTRYSYSNSNYVLLAEVVSRVAKEPLSTFAERRMFRPIGMTHTLFRDKLATPLGTHAIGYDRIPAAGYRRDFDSLFVGVGDGGLWTTVDDLLRWNQRFGASAIGGTRRSSNQLIRGVLVSGDTIPYAAGLLIEEYRGLKSIGHGGSFMGFRAEAIRFPTESLTVAILCNRDDVLAPDLAHRVADAALGRESDPNAMTTFDGPPAMAPETPGSGSLPSDLRMWVGAYRSGSSPATFAIKAHGDQLGLHVGGGVVPLAPDSAGRLRAVGAPVVMTFTRVSAPRGPGTISVDGGPLDGQRFEPVGNVTLPAVDFARYVGTFRSTELNATYRVKSQGALLSLIAPSSQLNCALVYVSDDTFTCGGAIIDFLRFSGRASRDVAGMRIGVEDLHISIPRVTGGRRVPRLSAKHAHH